MSTQWLKVEDIAQELDLHVNTVRGWIRDGKLKATKVGRDYRIKRQDYEKFLQERTTHDDTEKK
jgi:excisionase family DNA binding protein